MGKVKNGRVWFYKPERYLGESKMKKQEMKEFDAACQKLLDVCQNDNPEMVKRIKELILNYQHGIKSYTEPGA